ncbi:hypothetical protein [Streptomyces sioyaensis]|uniref:hypothetical protein n=1 Tax=Streptomyces sioyaensis TaxID=67364 RepID=UPI003D71C286
MSNENHSHYPGGQPQQPVDGAGPTAENEEELLHAEFGQPNDDGLYGTRVVD